MMQPLLSSPLLSIPLNIALLVVGPLGIIISGARALLMGMASGARTGGSARLTDNREGTRHNSALACTRSRADAHCSLVRLPDCASAVVPWRST